MKKIAKIWIGIVIGLWAIVTLLIVALPGETDNPYQEQNMDIIEQSLIKEISNGRDGICDEYDITENKITLWCVDDLYPKACWIVADRIDNTKGLQGIVEYDIAFRGWNTRKTINVLYDYKFQ